jgi:hypothetical protein
MGLQPIFDTACDLVCQQTGSVTCCPSKRGRERQRGSAGRGIAMNRAQRPRNMSPTTEKLHSKAHALNARFLEQTSLKGNIIRTIFSPLLGPLGAVVTGCCPVDDKAGPALGGH